MILNKAYKANFDFQKRTEAFVKLGSAVAPVLSNTTSITAIQSPQFTDVRVKTKRQDNFIRHTGLQQPFKTYIAEADISVTQQRIKGIEERAEF